MELRSEINIKNKDDIIPKDWISIRLGELADITSSKRIFAKEYSESVFLLSRKRNNRKI